MVKRIKARAVRSVVQRGFSIVEMMIGVAVGLFIIGGAVKLVVDTLSSNRNMVLETRVNQDLRTIADLIVRDLRRSGYWESATSGIWTAPTVIPAQSPYDAISPTGTFTNQSSITFTYDRDGAGETLSGICVTGNVAYLRQSGTSACGGGGWQPLNDAAVTRITQLSISGTESPTYLIDQCETPRCPDGTTVTSVPNPTCGPILYLRSYTVALTAQSADGSVSRQLVEQVRPRNERLNDQSVANNRCP
jgi:type IV pilus assembly protein PilW